MYGTGATDEIAGWAWVVFGVVVVVLLVVDLLAHRGERGQSRRAAFVWSLVWIGAGLAFNVFVWIAFGGHVAQEYLASYLTEKSLSLDNLFLFLIIFSSLNIPRQDQHRVLFWGILGAIVFRGLFIFVGAAALGRWDWISYAFGVILLYAAYRSYRGDPNAETESRLVDWLDRHLPFTRETAHGRFVTKRAGRLVASPLLLALLAIELTDIMFAVDSVAAALSMTRNEFVLYSSNIFAVLGLRALYLLLAHTVARMRYLHYGLAAVLAFAAVKILLHNVFHIPALLSVGIIAVIIGVAAWASVRAGRMELQEQAEREAAGLLPDDGEAGPRHDGTVDGTGVAEEAGPVRS